MKASTSIHNEPLSPAIEDVDADEDVTGISRQRIDPDEARNRFLQGRPKDSVNVTSLARSRRKPYQDVSRRRRGDEANGDGHTTSDDEKETLSEKLARLRREITEAKEALSEQGEQEQDRSLTSQKAGQTVEELDQALRSLQRPASKEQGSATDLLFERIHSTQAPSNITHTGRPTRDAINGEHGHPLTGDVQVLQRIADFDKRLATLEDALGGTGGSTSASSEKPIIPSIISIEKHISLLSSTSPSTYESANEKIKTLLQETSKLEEARKAAKAAQDESMSGHNRNRQSREAGHGMVLSSSDTDAEQASKISDLHRKLPVIESLSPILPSVLDRLRSLRTLHANAASASQNLSQMESRQDKIVEDLSSWKEGLERLENMMRQGDQVMKANMGSVEGWVKDLENRF